MNNQNSQFEKLDQYFWMIVIAGITPWILQQFHQSIHSDTAWLIIGAERLLSGQSMSAHIYETNPPLSLIFHIPIILLSKIGISVYYASTIYIGALLALSVYFIHLILSNIPYFEPRQVRVLSAVYIIIVTILAHVDFGQRDHVVIFGLFPFLLVQLCLTYDVKIPALSKWVILILGCFLILLKPPHGLLPALLWLHRLYKTRSVTVFKDPDFIVLFAGSLLYIAICWLVFEDYVTQILPDVLALYISPLQPDIIKKSVFYLIVGTVLIVTTLAFKFEKKTQNIIIVLFAFAAIALIPFVVQMKGFHYHLMPALTLFSCALFLLAFSVLKLYTSASKASVYSVLLCFCFAYTLSPLNPYYPRHEDYRNFEITKLVSGCAPECSFFMFTNNIAIVHPTAIYTRTTHGSRFPVYWFLPALLNWDGTPEKADEYRIKYADMTAQDLSYYKPELLIIGHFEIIGHEDEKFNFVDYFSISPAFNKQLSNYKRTKSIDVNQKEYFAGTSQAFDNVITYDIYQRNQ
jgi:hypothetical protein